MKIHIIGIAGTMTAALAVALKKEGHQITGSDQDKIYPPISTTLNSAKIKINNTNINKNIDLAIIGSSYNSFEKTRTEFEQIKKLKIKYISATEYIAKYVSKNNPILVAGSYGKTTITSLLVWIFKKANLNPSYMFGGQSLNKFDSLDITKSDWSIIEADESINGLDTQAKFLYYPAKYLILTSAQWEHKDSYKSESENFNAFKKLVSNLPKNGLLVINKLGFKTQELSKLTKARIVTYETQTDGNYDYENKLAAITLCQELGINKKIIDKAVATFKGVKRRLELVADSNNILFFDDFAQSAPRIKSTIEALKLKYPKRKIKVFYLPHASFLQYKDSLIGLKDAFNGAVEIVLGQIKFNKDISKEDRVSASDFKKEIGSKLIYLPTEQDIIKHYQQSLVGNDILIYMSSGGLSSQKTFKKIIKYV
ncbi:MAG: Mur ligase family protein [Candidatus Shapirobacteria bacterium]